MGVDGGRLSQQGAQVFQQVCFIIAVCLLLGRWVDAERNVTYVCPQCGSKRPDGHVEGCAWKR